MTPTLTIDPEIIYPESDGEPMAENTIQYRWIVTLNGNIDAAFAHDPNVFVGSDNFVYPVEGRPDIRLAPDVYVAFGRPKGDRGSYRVWDEGGLFPQVIIEVLSPGNRPREMAKKFLFYEEHGAEEYYIYDPDRNALTVYLRGPEGLDEVRRTADFVSPRIGCRFDLTGTEMVVYHPDGRPYLTYQERVDEAERQSSRASDAERRHADAERRHADAERRHADAERRAEKLAAKLRALGLDPDLNGT